ncbi:helix-turn-helix domain-containing protein [uncultured Anaeromusa sp.]|uniref:helix-turn-helix domain-containing protein n=1 Tax=uncultured Anaeromusa sp. TaxID=673273 RepID=UPI0029C76027|nr:helix-turn-helix domain-containing protein [uncultured Anaeromusa sp.]
MGAKPAARTNVQSSTSTDSPVLFTTTHAHKPLDITDSLSAGERITKLRDFRGWSKATLSARANLSIPIIKDCECGRILPTVATAKKLADALRAPIWYVGGYDHLSQKTLAEKIEKARKYRGHTKEEMASELGINQKSIYNWSIKGVHPLPETEKKLSLYIAVLKK